MLIMTECDGENDIPGMEELERRCETTSSSSGKMSLFTDLLGDPICRIRHSFSFLMLVAELGFEIEMVGVIKGCIKTVAYGKTFTTSSSCGSIRDNEIDVHDHQIVTTPICTKLAYILGLRVSPFHRRKGIGLKLVNQIEDWFIRKGIGLKLVNQIEEWFIHNGAEYSHMATELENKPFLNLFIKKCQYTKFRTPSILVQPVFAHRVKTGRTRFNIIKLAITEAEALYRRQFAATESFPHDIDRILQNKLNLGTLIAAPAESNLINSWPGSGQFLSNPPESWAIISAWNCKEAYALQVKGASWACRFAAKSTRLADRALPWLTIPSVPDVFRPFGSVFVYGLAGEGPLAGQMVKALCGHAHNIAKGLRCGVVATEVASTDPLRLAIPYWKKLSCADDVWCVKRLIEDYGDGPVGDWTKSRPGPLVFVDP